MTQTQTKFFAAYDADTIYAVATSRDAAIYAGAVETIGYYGSNFLVAEISEALFNQIERQGWDGSRQSFEIRNGELIETTNG